MILTRGMKHSGRHSITFMGALWKFTTRECWSVNFPASDPKRWVVLWLIFSLQQLVGLYHWYNWYLLLMLYSFTAQRQKKSNLPLLRCQTQVLSHLFSWKREYHQFAQVSQLFYCITGILGLFPCYALLFTSSPPCERLILERVFLRAWFVGN